MQTQPTVHKASASVAHGTRHRSLRPLNKTLNTKERRALTVAHSDDVSTAFLDYVNDMR